MLLESFLSALSDKDAAAYIHGSERLVLQVHSACWCCCCCAPLLLGRSMKHSLWPAHTHISTTNLSDELSRALCLAIERASRMGAVNVVEWELIDGFHSRLASLAVTARCKPLSAQSHQLSGQLVESVSYPENSWKRKEGAKRRLRCAGLPPRLLVLSPPWIRDWVG